MRVSLNIIHLPYKLFWDYQKVFLKLQFTSSAISDNEGGALTPPAVVGINCIAHARISSCIISNVNIPEMNFNSSGGWNFNNPYTCLSSRIRVLKHSDSFVWTVVWSGFYTQPDYLWISTEIHISMRSRQISTTTIRVGTIGNIEAFSRDELICHKIKQHLIGLRKQGIRKGVSSVASELVICIYCTSNAKRIGVNKCDKSGYQTRCRGSHTDSCCSRQDLQHQIH